MSHWWHHEGCLANIAPLLLQKSPVLQVSVSETLNTEVKELKGTVFLVLFDCDSTYMRIELIVVNCSILSN